MSNITLSPNASGTGSLTIAAPNTNSNRTLTLPDVTGTVVSTGDSGSVSQAMVATGVAGTGPAFSAYCSTNQSISTATYTKISLNTEEFDTNNNFDNTTNYRFTPNVAGYYLISGCIFFNLGITNLTNAQLHIYKNGNIFKSINFDNTSTAGHFGATVTSVIYMNGSTDYVEMYAYQGTGSSYSLVGASSNTYMSGALVRAA